MVPEALCEGLGQGGVQFVPIPLWQFWCHRSSNDTKILLQGGVKKLQVLGPDTGVDFFLGGVRCPRCYPRKVEMKTLVSRLSVACHQRSGKYRISPGRRVHSSGRSAGGSVG